MLRYDDFNSCDDPHVYVIEEPCLDRKSLFDLAMAAACRHPI